jgi:tetratricopeptide (TPR) repeat protein
MSRTAIGMAMGLALLGAMADVRAEQGQSTQTSAQAVSPEPAPMPDQLAQAQFNIGIQLMHDRKFAGAAQAFERATGAHTNFPEAYNNWGISLVQLGKQGFNGQQQLQYFQAAAEKFNKAAEQRPGEKITYILWSETLLLIGDLPVDSRTRLACYQGAVDKCRRAAELAPDDWDAYNKWAVILSTKLPDYAVNDQARLELYKEAASVYAKAADHARFSSEIGPVYANWASALVQAARVSTDRQAKQSLLREALGKFERAAKVHPGAAGTYAMWGSALIDLGKASRLRNDLRDAVEKLSTSLALRPDDPGTLYNLARVYALLGQPVMAVQNLKNCFDADRTQTYRQTAAQDPDLTTLRGDSDFDELMGGTTPHSLPTYNPHLTDRPR